MFILLQNTETVCNFVIIYSNFETQRIYDAKQRNT